MSETSEYITPKLHTSFLLNNKSFNERELETYAHHLVRTGEQYQKDVGDFLLDWLDNEPYIQVNTSGSTGTPKTIKVLKEHMVNSAKATATFFKIPEGSSALLCLSAGYISGKMMLVRAMVLGWKLDVVAPKVAPLEDVYKQYDFCAMVPMQLDNSLNRLHLLKKLIVGGGSIPEHLIAIVQGVKTKIYETYGMTETVSHIAARRVNSKKKDISECFFKTLPQVVIAVDHRNCLVIKAPLLSKETLTTNDIVDIITYKKFVWKGRFDNVINSGGIKLFPEQIEKKLQLIIRQRFFVSSESDPKLGNKLILIIENITKTISAEAYLDKIKELKDIGKYEVPKKIYFLDKFIETGTGKVHRINNRLKALNINK